MMRATLCLILVAICVPTFGAEEAKEKKITFDEHIKPIFREHCTACHAEGDKASDLALDTYASTLAGGSSGDVIAEGDPGGSRLFALVTHAEQPYMPPDEDPMAKEKLDLIQTWIEQGMPENAGSKIKRSNNAAAAMLSTVSLGKPDGPPPMPENVLRQAVVETQRSAAISAMAASPWAPLLAVGGQQQVSLYHATSGELLGILPFPEGEPQSLTFTRDGKQLLIGGGRHSHSGCAVLVDIASGKRIAKVGDELDIVMAADITADKQRIAIAGPQKVVRIYDTMSGEKLFDLKKHTDWIFALRFSPDGVLLASGDRSNGLILWEADTGNLYSELVGHRGEVRSLDFRADSNVLASASLDGTIKLWDMFESKQIKSWNAHGGGATAVAYAQNGMLVSTGRDQRVKLWDGNGGLKNQYQGLAAAGLEVAIAGDATYVAGGDWAGSVRLWQADNPKQPTTIAANPLGVESRLRVAQAELAEAQADHTKATQTNTKAQARETNAAANLAQVGTAKAKWKVQFDAASSEKSTLDEATASIDSQIAALEKQLAALHDKRIKNQTRISEVAQSLKRLAPQARVFEEQIAAATKQHEAAQIAKQESAAQLAASQRVLDAARARFEKAEQDKAALVALADELTDAVQSASKTSTKLETEVASAINSQATQATVTSEAQKQLDALKAQLAELQEKLQAANATFEKAQSELQTKKEKAESLQEAFEKAQGQKLEAEEAMKLFQQAYGLPK